MVTASNEILDRSAFAIFNRSMDTLTDRYAAREAFVKGLATTKRDKVLDQMVTTVDLRWDDELYLHLRIFKSQGEWVMVEHRPADEQLRRIGVEYEIQGLRTHQAETRQRIFFWIALHWQDIVDRMMEASR